MLLRFDPFRELDRMSQASNPSSTPRRSAMPMDAFREGDRFVVDFDLPGVDPNSIDLTVEKHALTVTAERAVARGDDVEVVAAERTHGRFSRQLLLGDNLDQDAIEARYDRGVLTLTIPVAEKAKPRKIAVSSGVQQALEVDAKAS